MKIKLLSYGNVKIQTIKVVRNYTGLGLREAKAIVDSVPSVINSDDFDNCLNTTADVNDFVNELISVGADAVIVGSKSHNISKDIKKVMRKAFEADEFELLQKLVVAYEFSLEEK